MTGTAETVTRFTDEWSGFSLMLPKSWRCETFWDVTLVYRPGEPEPAAMVWPMELPELTTISKLTQNILEIFGKGDPSFNAEVESNILEGAEEKERLVKINRVKNNITIQGTLKVSLTGDNTAVVTGIQAPSHELAGRAEHLWSIVSSYEKTDSIPKEQFVEKSEGAFSFHYPKRWLVYGKVERDQPNAASGPVKLRWSIEDPSTGAKVYSDGLTLDFLFYPSGGFGNPMAQMMMANPQMSWKVQPFTGMKEFAETMILQLARQMKPDIRLERAVIDPGLEKLAREGFKPVEENLGKRVELSAGYTISTYTENGVKFRENCVICNWMIPDTPNPMAIMPQPQYWFCTLGPIYRAPQELFDAMNPLLRGIAASYKPNQDREQQQADMFAKKIESDRMNAEQKRKSKLEGIQSNIDAFDQQIVGSRKQSMEHVRRAGLSVFLGQ